MSYAYFPDLASIKAAGVPVAADVKLSDLQTHIRRAVQWFLLPYLGPELVAQVEAGELTELLELIRPVLAGYALSWYAPVSQRVVTGTGTEALPGTKENANTDKLNAQHKADLQANAEQALEALLCHLELHPADYPGWHASRYCTRVEKAYFQTVEQFRAYPAGPQTRREFLRVQGAIQALVLHRVLFVLGRPLHQRLLAELDDPAHADVLAFIRLAIVDYLGDDTQAQGQATLELLKQTLQDELEAYPEYQFSPCYIPAEPVPTTSAHSFNAIC